MSFGLAFPLGLLALLGLALPLLVHLARREQQQPTMFAALRWLRAVRRPRQKLRLEQWLLLALRLLLVAGLALLLAAPWFLPDEGGAACEGRVEGLRRGQSADLGLGQTGKSLLSSATSARGGPCAGTAG